MNTKKKKPILQWVLFEWTDKKNNKLRRKFLKVGVQNTLRPDILNFRFYHYKKTLEKWGFDFDLNSFCAITYEFNSYKIDVWRELSKSVAFRAYSLGALGNSVVDLYLHNHK